MISNRKINELAYHYVITMSSSKKYNPQTIANISVLSKYGKKRVVEILEQPIKQFCESYQKHVVRDFVYKSDYFTPRNMYLINPLYYMYYTSMVFKLSRTFLEGETNLDFSREQMTLFYSGIFDLQSTQQDIKKNAIYNESYKLFQKERENFFGQPVLKIDVQEFFNSIKITELVSKLRRLIGEEKIVDDLEYFFKFCGFDSLPQLHYSIASSILSQFYLNEFDAKMQRLLLREELYLLRFVDDMYIIHLDGVGSNKKNNNILNEISYFLWQDSLVLNTKKTKMLTPDEYINGYELMTSEYGATSFSSERLLNEKAEEIIDKGYLIKLIEKLCKMEKENGIDLEKYKILMEEYLSLRGEDANKILSNIIYSKKWMNIKKTDLIKLVDNWRYILFNPSYFTVLYIFIYRYLEKEKLIMDEGFKIRRILNYIYKSEVFTFRDTLVAVTYLLQSNLKNQNLIQRIKKVNPDYVKFVESFITD